MEVIKMEYLRYGGFRFSDYTSAWFAMVFLFVLVIVGFLTDTPFYLLIWPLLFSVIMAWSIYKPNRERFWISDDTITIIQGVRKQKVAIPTEATVIVSYADVCPPLARRVSYGNQTYMLKGRYAVSILHKMPLETVLGCLHRNYARKYTTSTIEFCFDEWCHVYSFVCTQELLDQLLTKGYYQLIIPESLLERVSINHNTASVYVDAGY